MRNEKLIWQLFPTHVLILFSAILAVAWFGSQSLREFYIDQMVNNLKSRTRLIEPLVTDLLINGDIDELTQICLEAGIKASTRITVVDLKGEVVCDSEHDPIKMGNHANRPEIIQALAKDFGTSIRYSATLQTDMIYVAIPIDGPAARIGVLRMSFPVFSIDKKLREIYWQIIIATVFVVIIAAAITLLVSKKITQPLVEMKLGAERFAAGEFSEKLAVSGSEEIVSLAQAMNTMAAQLDDRIQAVLDQRNELETMFASMVEGVITVDAEERIINLNEAAAEMLRVEPAHSERKNILEVVRNIELLRFIQRVLSGIEPVERSIVLNRGKQDERVLQVHGARLSGGIKSKAGALIVINDVTHLLKLENVRRDFVANVSHELKTPITSIKGYVETLLDDNFQDVEQVRSFLKIISKQSNRLHAIV
ncbi:MAG: histidine kinase dimerization/phospho-acceptor domain-containing protein, partial [Thermodesulfobacteriota bacterium]